MSQTCQTSRKQNSSHTRRDPQSIEIFPSSSSGTSFGIGTSQPDLNRGLNMFIIVDNRDLKRSFFS